MSTTDYLRLGELKIYKELRESLPKNINKTLNLLTVQDNVLFTWDFQNSYVLSLNIKAARSREGDNVIHQKLLPLSPPLFSPEGIIANENGTLLVIFGPSGILVLQLPNRCPPYGSFDNNKEVVYCRSHSLDERLLACGTNIEVRQVKFHPGSYNLNHILALTSDNMLRLYQIKNNEALRISVIPIGEKPTAMFPGSKTPFLECFGEVAVDFDFGHPQITNKKNTQSGEYSRSVEKYRNNTVEEKYMVNVETQTIEKIIPQPTPEKQKRCKGQLATMVWPIYILRGDFTLYSIIVELDKNSKSEMKGPLTLSGFENHQSETCSLMCLNTVPQIVCIGLSSGTICHAILLDNEDEDDGNDDVNVSLKSAKTDVSSTIAKEIIAFETIELELGLTTTEVDSEKYKCPIFLHKDITKPGRYYATHAAGVHCVTISSVEELQNFVNEPDDIEPTLDIFATPSKAEYLVCTKTASSAKTNPVIGFSVYFEPASIITLLSGGSLISLSIVYTGSLPKIEELSISHDDGMNSSLKKMVKEPFDIYIQKILRKASTQPVLKLAAVPGESNQEQSYEILQRSVQVFREDYFKHHTKAKEELEKRIQTLLMMKNNQQKEIKIMMKEKELLQDKASTLAEKYEDIKDKQDELLKRCENLLMLVNQRKGQPSDAENIFIENLQLYSKTVADYWNQMDKLKNKLKYQQLQMENWKSQENKKKSTMNEQHTDTIKTNLEATSKQIVQMIKEINEFKKVLNIK